MHFPIGSHRSIWAHCGGRMPAGRTGLAILAAACLLNVTACTDVRGARPVEVRRVWDQAPHNAFTDLVRFRGQWYLTFREASVHAVPRVGTPGGKIRVLRSADGDAWVSAALLDHGADQDLRDPKLTITPDGRLMLNAAVAPEAAPNDRQSLVWFSADGRTWTGPEPIADPNVWLWRVAWHGDQVYGFGYGRVVPQFIRLYRSSDGRAYHPHVDNLLSGDSFPNETALLFLKDGTAYALVRRDKGTATGLLGTSLPPYTKWTFKDLGTRIGGPAFLQIPDGRFVAAVRLYDGKVRTALCWLDPAAGTLAEFYALPSGGDTSYAGMAWHRGRLWVSYYSSHEGKASIYLAKVNVNANLPSTPAPAGQ